MQADFAILAATRFWKAARPAISQAASRPFPNAERAWEWLHALQGQRIRVHVQPGKPEVAVVLAAKLDAHFPLPVRTPEDLAFAQPEIYTQ